MTVPRRNRLIAIAVAAPMLLAALYTVGWFVLADRWRAAMERWIGAEAQSGWTMSTGPVTATGFPGAIRLSLPEPKAVDAAGNGWQGPPTTILISPFAPLDPGVEAPGRHLVSLAGRAPTEITAAALTGHLIVAHGKPVALSVNGATLSGLGMTAEGATLDLRQPPPAAEGQIATPLAATLGIDRLTVPETLHTPLDRTIVAAHLALRLRGDIPKGATATALSAWRESGGTLEIDSLDIDWPPLVAAGNATIALDKALQPELAGTVTLRGGDKAIERAAAAGMLPKPTAMVAKLALGLASKPAGDGASQATLPLRIQNRILSVGPVPLLQLPEIGW